MAARVGVALVAVLTVVVNVAIGWGWPFALAAGVTVLLAGELAGQALVRLPARRPSQALPASASHGRLSRREVEVARLVAESLSNKEIGRRLFIGEKTVERHLDNINKKLGLHSRVQLTNWVRDHGLLAKNEDPDEDPMRTSPDS